MAKKGKANRSHNTRKYKAHASGITSASWADFDKTVIVTRIDPQTGEQTVTTTQASYPKRRRTPT